MNELSEFEFDTIEEKDEVETGRFKRDGKGPNWWWLVVLIVVAVVAGLVYWSMRSEPAAEPEPEVAAPTVPAEAPEPAPESEEALELPDLDASDELVAQLVQALSGNPRFAGMLVSDSLVRRFTAAIVNISEGQTPRAHLEALEPPEPYSVRRIDGQLVPSAKSYARYDLVADVVSSLDTEGTAKLYRQLHPLIEESFVELGYPGVKFDEVLLAALDHLIATPVIDADVELVEKVTVYSFADPQLEDLSAAQKQLLRTGPENTRKIQAALRSLRGELIRGG